MQDDPQTIQQLHTLNNVTSQVPSPHQAPPNSSSTSSNDQDLAIIKNKALEQLEPLLDQSELSIEDRFKTTMMMLQASDNQELVKRAYELAQQIKNPKIKAQALLDIINEINYFSQINQA